MRIVDSDFVNQVLAGALEEGIDKEATSNYSAEDWVKQVEMVLKNIHNTLAEVKNEKHINARTESDLKSQMKFLNDWMKELEKGI